MTSNKGTLYITATPIGNTKDITLRALEILSSVDIILAEDTRKTKNLLTHHTIKYKKLMSYHDHSSQAKINQITNLLLNNNNIALVSDAGTPLISDPGYKLIRHLRMMEINIIAIPGPSSITAALSMIGISGNSFKFHGFSPNTKQARFDFYQDLCQTPGTNICFESCHKIREAIEQLCQFYFEKIYLIKEISKIYEKVIFANPAEILEMFSLDNSLEKGEFIIILDNFNSKQSKKNLAKTDKEIIDILTKTKKVKLAKLLYQAFEIKPKDFLSLIDSKK